MPNKTGTGNTNNLSNKGRDEKCFRIVKAKAAAVVNKVRAVNRVAGSKVAGKAAAVVANRVAEAIVN